VRLCARCRRGLRSGEHLVPGREARALPIDYDRELAPEARDIGWAIVFEHERQQIVVERALHATLDGRIPTTIDEDLGRQQERRAGGPRTRRPRSGTDELRALDELRVNFLSGVNLLLELRAPRDETVSPRLDREHPTTDTVDVERSIPSIAVEVVLERRTGPIAFAGPAIEDHRGDLVVSLLDDVGTDPDRVADDAFDGVPSGVELWRDAFDDDVLHSTRAYTAVGRLSCSQGGLRPPVACHPRPKYINIMPFPQCLRRVARR
jgi:hypothetical protein